MRIVSLIFLSFFISPDVTSQGVDNLWLMGYGNPSGYPSGGTKINYKSQSPIMSYENRKINLNCTNGLISNSNGDLLFVSNGIFIQNAANDTMLNGSGLNPSYFTTT